MTSHWQNPDISCHRRRSTTNGERHRVLGGQSHVKTAGFYLVNHQMHLTRWGRSRLVKLQVGCFALRLTGLAVPFLLVICMCLHAKCRVVSCGDCRFGGHGGGQSKGFQEICSDLSSTRVVLPFSTGGCDDARDSKPPQLSRTSGVPTVYSCTIVDSQIEHNPSLRAVAT